MSEEGRFYRNVVRLLNDAGFGAESDENVYIPRTASPGLEAKIMKPQAGEYLASDF
jgi:hypothetical protein